ncbi:hypothetical protein LOZ12_004403 [Ophidiomyces ophidiicola]|uniref:uncharacterized protein n=1 Tax=Ophidiomyces ophidiicola TaxID=1387563 RepID=UPI0020C1FDA3|nr:uncharacterized protein LOZ57_003001 [Ophidiomyces ophidiicola]KAI1947850.1 hypothetical protein LOZ57_003001 [Ophidiomyces ophidiicola]KAI2227349.1 hypothetical protein LOZ12_004403 [Ophidiomyces ophidiicola]
MASPVYHPLRLVLAPNLPVDMPLPDGSCSSSASTPEPDTTAAAAHPPKRKGGRKPIYATSEERKQRNRQAQAAFRERRSEYIKQLEATIQRHEDALRALQQNHRAAADECLMLRYKNSLLERLLLEKGIDVHAELRLKTTTTTAAAAAAPANALPAAQRPHQKSPFARPPPLAHPGGFSAPAAAAALTPVSMNSPDSNPTPRPPSNSSASGPARSQAPYFMVPFQKHYDPLEPEYDPPQHQHSNNHNHSHADCPPSSSSHNPTTTPFGLPRPNSNNHNNNPPHPDILAQLGDDGLGSLSAFVDHFDPMLDADPFGLSASMHFHTPLSYTQSNIR